jgi:antitoxin (DNA-binding transcriptional repressor) of toxin-antitoxin stability system
MAERVIRISEEDAANNFGRLLAQVRSGAEVVIEGKGRELPVTVVLGSPCTRRTISECIALLSQDSTAVMDAEFARDVESAVASHREPLEAPEWE